MILNDKLCALKSNASETAEARIVKYCTHIHVECHRVNVLTSNITFLIFAVLVVRHSHCRPYKPF